MAACREGKPQWGDKGPQNAGCYNSLPSGVPFFEEGNESFLSDYGRFFLVLCFICNICAPDLCLYIVQINILQLSCTNIICTATMH